MARNARTVSGIEWRRVRNGSRSGKSLFMLISMRLNLFAHAAQYCSSHHMDGCVECRPGAHTRCPSPFFSAHQHLLNSCLQHTHFRHINCHCQHYYLAAQMVCTSLTHAKIVFSFFSIPVFLSSSGPPSFHHPIDVV